MTSKYLLLNRKFQHLTSLQNKCFYQEIAVVDLMNKKRKQLSVEERAKICTSLLNRGKIREVIRFICNQETGEIYVPDDIEEKSGNFI